MNRYSPNHPSVMHQLQHGTTPTNRNAFIRRRRGAQLMGLFVVSLVAILLGGWIWIGNQLGLAMFFVTPILLAVMFMFAVELLETPLEKGNK